MSGQAIHTVLEIQNSPQWERLFKLRSILWFSKETMLIAFHNFYNREDLTGDKIHLIWSDEDWTESYKGCDNQIVQGCDNYIYQVVIAG